MTNVPARPSIADSRSIGAALCLLIGVGITGWMLYTVIAVTQMQLGPIGFFGRVAAQPVPGERKAKRYKSADRELDALVGTSLIHNSGADESSVSIAPSKGIALCTHDFSSPDGQHGYVAETAEWTPDSQYFVMRMRNSGGHSPTFAPIVFWSRNQNRFYSLNSYTGDTTFSVAPPDVVNASTWPEVHAATFSLHLVKEADKTELPCANE